MTEREPDDLYDALRDRLTDFGQEPPAALWAGIRAQLPPPVARPQLRRRRWAIGLGLLLLLLVVSVGSWKLWERGPQKTAFGPELAATSTAAQRPQPGAAHPANAASQGAANGTPPTETEVTQAGTNASTTIHSTTFPTDNRPVRPLAVAKARLAAPATDQPTRAAVAPATDATLGRFATGENSREPTTATTRAARKTALATAAAHRPARQAAAAKNGATGPSGKALAGRKARGYRSAAGEMAGRRGAMAPAARPAATNTRGTAPGPRPATRPGLAATPPTAALDATGRVAAGSQAQPVSSNAPDALGGAGASSVEAAGQDSAAASQAGARSFAVVSRLSPRLVGLGMVPLATATATLRAPDYQPFVLTKAARWAVQVLAGPALTHRYLALKPALQSTPPGFTSPAANTSVAELERPALGYGGQVAVRRVLNDRWAVSAGLGYAEYGTRLAIQRVGTITLSNTPGSATADSLRAPAHQTATDIHRRDTYRFVTVPLRVSYSLVGSRRWQLGLLGGAEVAAYIGGTSTEGTACACQTQTWGATGSPYRRLSLGISLGAELRYHLTDRWSLLAQPTSTYFLNSLAQPTSAFRQRHLFGGTALLGVSVDLP